MLSLPVPPNSILHQRAGQGHKLNTPVSIRVCLGPPVTVQHLGDTDSRKGPPQCKTLTLKKGPTQSCNYHLARLPRQRRIELYDESA